MPPPVLVEPALPAVAGRWAAVAARIERRTAPWSDARRGLAWAALAGLFFCLLNALVRRLTLSLDPFQAQFLRYAFGFAVLLPLLWRRGLAHYRPVRFGPHFTRGALHALGLCLWFAALPRIPLADMTAIGFTTPLFIMLEACWCFGSRCAGNAGWPPDWALPA